MSIEQFYNDLKSKKKSVKNNELSKLYQRPVKETGIDAPKWQVLEPNYIHQADVLYLPEDTVNKKKYRYVLVVADVYNKVLDAEPITSLRQDDHEILDGLKTIYNRGILKYPKIIMFDNGNENKDKEIEKFMRSHRVNMRFMVPARYRQISTVKTAKRKIGSILHKRMASEEKQCRRKKSKKSNVDEDERESRHDKYGYGGPLERAQAGSKPGWSCRHVPKWLHVRHLVQRGPSGAQGLEQACVQARLVRRE
jgi:hypothetical protein